MPQAPQPCQHLVAIYKCLCDLNRLRILNLLRSGPQCVCLIEGVLGIGPARTSQQLAYLRRHGLVAVAVRGTWRIYSLPATPSPELAANLACLQDCTAENPVFREDLLRLKELSAQICAPEPA
jgi:ArsR family transcriptional regulator, arsenate/arsenite/antimonite-responsive transcriptional repressor